jgi:ribonuclease HII
MRFAVENLDPRPDCLLIDGTCRIPMPQTVAGSPFQQAIPKGDRLSISISAASIVAKVTRDRMMAQYHEQYPQYNFARHKGYPTEQHRQAIRTSGICFIHRRSFQGVLESTCKRSPINSENPGKVLRQITFENAGISSSS